MPLEIVIREFVVVERLVINVSHGSNSLTQFLDSIEVLDPQCQWADRCKSRDGLPAIES
jgi:hypothetical protein